jgi:hypothetical protein
LELSGQKRGFKWWRDRYKPETLAAPPGDFEAKHMAQDFIFAQDVILDPDTGKVVAVVRNREVYRDGARIAVLVGAQMYDLNGNLLGQLAAGAGSLPISFKNLLEGKSALGPRWRSYASPRGPQNLRRRSSGKTA